MNEPRTGDGPQEPPAGDGVPGNDTHEDTSGGTGPGTGTGAGTGRAGTGPDAAAHPDEPAGPVPLGVDRTPTGNPDVDARTARLADIDGLPADGHLEVYEDVHRGLRDTLAALDQRPGPPAPSAPYDHRS